jgi:hypothetical protein
MRTEFHFPSSDGVILGFPGMRNRGKNGISAGKSSLCLFSFGPWKQFKCLHMGEMCCFMWGRN